MRINKKKIFIIVVVAILILPITKYIQIKKDFSNYLNSNYPEASFDIGRIKYDPFYPKIYAKVKSDDGIEFIIKRPPGDKRIFESYLKGKYEKEVVEVIEKYLGQELLKNTEYIRCYIDTKEISYPGYTIEDLQNNIDYLAVSYERDSMNSFYEFFDTAVEIFEKLEDQNIKVTRNISVDTYTSDNLECTLLKENGSYTLYVKVINENNMTNEEYLQKRNEIQEIAYKSKLKITSVDISCKGDLK